MIAHASFSNLAFPPFHFFFRLKGKKKREEREEKKWGVLLFLSLPFLPHIILTRHRLFHIQSWASIRQTSPS